MLVAAVVDLRGQAQDEVQQPLVAVDARSHQAAFECQLAVFHLHQRQRHAGVAIQWVAIVVEQLAQRMAAAGQRRLDGCLLVAGRIDPGAVNRAGAPETGAPVGVGQWRRHSGQELQAKAFHDRAGRALVARAALGDQDRLVIGEALPVAQPQREQAVDHAGWRRRRLGAGLLRRRQRRSWRWRWRWCRRGRGRGRGPVRIAAAVVDHHRIQAVAHRHDDLAAQPVDRHARIDADAVAADAHAQSAQNALAEGQAIEEPLLELAVVLLHLEVLDIHALAVEVLVPARLAQNSQQGFRVVIGVHALLLQVRVREPSSAASPMRATSNGGRLVVMERREPPSCRGGGSPPTIASMPIRAWNPTRISGAMRSIR